MNRIDMRIYVEEDMQDCELHDLEVGKVGVFSHSCPGAERPNQDAASLITVNGSAMVLAVADGMGGAKAGGRAASLAIEALGKHILNAAPDSENLRTAILDGIESANREVQALGVGAATTLAVAEIQRDFVRSYHVGDSVVLAIGQRGKVKLQTLSHSPVGYAVESGLLNEDEAMHHDERHLVSNVIGSSDMSIEIGAPVKLSRNDTVLLSSDGLFDNLETTEIIELSRKGPLENVMQELINLCQHRMDQFGKADAPSKPDDVTFITFRPQHQSERSGE